MRLEIESRARANLQGMQRVFPGRYRVGFTHNGVPAQPREVSVASAGAGSSLPTASMRSGERGC